MTEFFDLRRARINAGLSQRELAKNCGVPLSTVQRLEDRQGATPRNAKRVADFFSTDEHPVLATDLLPLPEAA